MRIALWSIVLVLAVAGCELFGSKAPADEGRIQFGRSIDGIRIGDDTTAVNDKLGRPDFIGYGDFAGVIYSYVYPNPDGDGYRDSLEVTIWHDSGVKHLTVKDRYTGRSKNGIGIGSRLKNVHDHLGTPDDYRHDRSPEHRVDTYVFDENRFDISYYKSNVQSISMHASPR